MNYPFKTKLVLWICEVMAGFLLIANGFAIYLNWHQPLIVFQGVIAIIAAVCILFLLRNHLTFSLSCFMIGYVSNILLWNEVIDMLHLPNTDTEVTMLVIAVSLGWYSILGHYVILILSRHNETVHSCTN